MAMKTRGSCGVLALKGMLLLLSALVFALPFIGIAHADYAYVTLDYPGAYSTYAYGIDGNNIVGYYYAGLQERTGPYGFLYNGSTYTPLPNISDATFAYGISGTKIVGTSATYDHFIAGFLYNGSTSTTIQVPDASYTFAQGISGTNIVGYYGDATGDHGFLYNYGGSNYTPLNFPGAMGT
jgi:hypothetical protein